jgi:hypothetical protein
MSNETFWRFFPLFFAALWLGISLFISWIGGWQKLARRYSTSEKITGVRFWMRSAGMRWGASYRGCLNLGAAPQGLYLSVFPLFRAGHPPLLIPWSDISITRVKWIFLDSARLEFREVPDVPLFISLRLATRVFANGPNQFEAA